MAWTIEFRDGARRQLAKLDRQVSRRILRYLENEVLAGADPRRLGKALAGPLAGAWRYRVGDYRIICRLEDARLVVLVLDIGHRGDVYR